METELGNQLKEEHVPADKISFLRYADMRYKNQEHCVKVTLVEFQVLIFRWLCPLE